VPRFINSHKRGAIEWVSAPDVKKRVSFLADTLDIDWIRKSRIFCFRSTDAKTRAYARIWGFSRIWQKALREQPAYVIEVVSEKYDSLPAFEQDKVLLHEMTHIPRNFSGSLIPHIRRGERNFEDKVRTLIALYNRRR